MKGPLGKGYRVSLQDPDDPSVDPGLRTPVLPNRCRQPGEGWKDPHAQRRVLSMSQQDVLTVSVPTHGGVSEKKCCSIRLKGHSLSPVLINCGVVFLPFCLPDLCLNRIGRKTSFCSRHHSSVYFIFCVTVFSGWFVRKSADVVVLRHTLRFYQRLNCGPASISDYLFARNI